MNQTQILVVEDEGIVAKDLQSMLKRLGYRVPATVGTGEAAIKTALENQPDLILMDIQLRGSMDGVQAAAAINLAQDVPIVYLTANSDEATLQRAKGTAPFGFLVKPFEERAIQAGIEMALYKHSTDKRIRVREQWLATTLSCIADAVITTDPNGAITFLNSAAEKISGWARDEAVGCAYAEVFNVLDENTRTVPTDRIAEALTDGSAGSFSNQTILVRRDGSEIHIEHSVAPIRQGLDQAIDGCVIVFSDVSDRRNLEDRLRHAQKMDAIGKLAGGIAHDFNNAITAIIGYAELVLYQVQQDDPLAEDLRQIVRAAEHSARLTHQLLAFSRKQVLQPCALDLHEELIEVEGMVRRLIGESVSLVVEATPGLWKTMADRGQIHQVVLNLAINARDAMPQGGMLTLGVRNVTVSERDAVHIPDGRPGEFVVLTISDTGTGMGPETMKQIFEPFFTTKEPGKGTGLGLATCHGIVRQTSGMIATSSKLGVGTTFSIYLPRASSAGAATTRISNIAGLPAGSGTILLVEDEDMLRDLAAQVLRGQGYKVIPAENGMAAVECFQSGVAKDVDLVVTDMVMPRMNGRELVSWIAENIGEMRVLFMSGYTDDDIIRTAVEGSEIDYLQKPFTPTAFARKIREVLDRPAIGRLRSDQGLTSTKPLYAAVAKPACITSASNVSTHATNSVSYEER